MLNRPVWKIARIVSAVIMMASLGGALTSISQFLVFSIVVGSQISG
jgi:hypothetical protein